VTITARGKDALSDDTAQIDNQYLKQFEEFVAFQNQSNDSEKEESQASADTSSITPDEALRVAYN